MASIIFKEREHKQDINKAQWRFFTKVVQCVLDIGGLIFGGAVRDIYARDYNARQFYETVGYSRATEFYLDDEYRKKYKDRMIIPKDLDASIHHTKLASFFQILKEKNIQVRTLFTRDAKSYLPNINVEQNEIIHWRLELRLNIFVKLDKPSFVSDLLNNEFEALMVKMTQVKKDVGTVIVDLMVNKTDNEMDPPFGNLDFECNGLILSKDGIRLSRCLHDRYKSRIFPLELDDKLAKIKKDILHKRAVPISQKLTTQMAYRTSKMILKRYTIHMQDIITINDEKISKPKEQLNCCILCHEDFKNTKHYKLSCCEARYHEKCLILIAFKGKTALMRTHNCIMCRQRIPEPTRNELDLMRCIFVTNTNGEDIQLDIEFNEEEDIHSDSFPLGFYPPTPDQEETDTNNRYRIQATEDSASSSGPHWIYGND
uniref:Uncharacterized protein n=1 Tax=viral metagenome TaxID=1070528 RepID=A0A6C0CS95_9ZZZZ